QHVDRAPERGDLKLERGDLPQLRLDVLGEALVELRPARLPLAGDDRAHGVHEGPVAPVAEEPEIFRRLIEHLRARSWLPPHSHQPSTTGGPIPTAMILRALAQISSTSLLVGARASANNWSAAARMNLPRQRGGTARARACTTSTCSGVSTAAT